MAASGEHEVVPMDEIDGIPPSTSEVDAASFLHRENNTGHFKYDVADLRQLMEYRGAEAVDYIRDHYGTIHNLCQDLFTSENEGT